MTAKQARRATKKARGAALVRSLTCTRRRCRHKWEQKITDRTTKVVCPSCSTAHGVGHGVPADKARATEINRP